MALSTYTELQSSIADWTHRTDLSPMIADFVALAEARISRDLRLRMQIKTASLVTVPNVQAIAIPSDWLEFENVSIVDGSVERQMTYVNVEHLDSKYPSGSYTGLPTVYTIEGDTLPLGPVPSGAYTVKVLYYARFASLVSSATNWLLTNHPNIYLGACLYEAFDYAQDDANSAKWLNKYASAVKQLQDQDDKSTHSGSALRVRTI